MKNKSYKYLLQENGYCLIKNFFNINEVEKLRKFVLKNHHNDQDIYLSNYDNALDENILSEKYFQILKETIGNDLVYFLDSNTAVDAFQKNTGTFHIDARNDENDPGSSEYKVWRVGLYLQDHKNYSGGIKFIAKSHKKLLTNSIYKIYYILRKFFKNKYSLKSIIPSFKYINIPSEPGDLIIWNGRTHHCGRFKRLHIFKNLALHPFIDRHLPNFLIKKEMTDRLVVYQDWGLKDLSLVNYLKHRYNHRDYKKYWQNNKINKHKFPFNKFKENSIEIIDASNIDS